MMTRMMPIDRTQYFLVPRTVGRRLLSLGRLLVKYKPKNPSADVEETGELLTGMIVKLTQAFVDRHREGGTSVAVEEVELDAIVDTLWYILRDRVLHWEL